MDRTYLKPMLCATADELPREAGWIMEPKLDGWRFLFHKDENGKVWSYGGRNGADHTGKARRVELELAHILPPDTIVDAELVAVGEGMISSDVASALARGGELTCVVFDVLRVAGHDARSATWTERRALAERIFQDVASTYVSLNQVRSIDQGIFEGWLRAGLEGVVCKRTDSTYRSGKRAREWKKLKPTKSIDCKIIELPRDGGGKFAGQVGSVVFDIGNGKRGRASGMTDAVRMDMTVNPAKYVGKMAEFSYQLQTRGGHLRHPNFVRMRPDRDAA